LVAAKDLKAGAILTQEDLTFARNATDFSSNDLESLIGKHVNEDIPKGHLILKKAIGS